MVLRCFTIPSSGSVSGEDKDMEFVVGCGEIGGESVGTRLSVVRSTCIGSDDSDLSTEYNPGWNQVFSHRGSVEMVRSRNVCGSKLLNKCRNGERYLQIP